MVILLLRGRANVRSLWEAAVPIEKRLLFATWAPKLKAGFEARLGPHCEATKLNDGGAPTGGATLPPNLNTPVDCDPAPLEETPFASPFVAAKPKPGCCAPNWNPPWDVAVVAPLRGWLGGDACVPNWKPPWDRAKPAAPPEGWFARVACVPNWKPPWEPGTVAPLEGWLALVACVPNWKPLWEAVVVAPLEAWLALVACVPK